MSLGTGVIGHVTGEAQEYTSHVHEFTHGERGKEDADQEDMGEEEGADPFRNHRAEGDKTHGQLFDSNDIHLGEIPHGNTGGGNADDQEEREVVGRLGDVVDFLVKDPPSQKEEGGCQKHDAGDEQSGQAQLHNAVKEFQPPDAGRNRVGEKPQVPEQDDQERVVEGQRAYPEENFKGVGESVGCIPVKSGFRVSEQ